MPIMLPKSSLFGGKKAICTDVAGHGAQGPVRVGVGPTAPPGLSKDPGERCAAFNCPVQTRRFYLPFSVRWMSAVS